LDEERLDAKFLEGPLVLARGEEGPSFALMEKEARRGGEYHHGGGDPKDLGMDAGGL